MENEKWKKSPIEQIINGDRHVDNIKFTARDRELLDKVEELAEKFKASIRDVPNALEELDEYEDAVDEFQCEQCIDYYKEGFRFGFMLALDVFEVNL